VKGVSLSAEFFESLPEKTVFLIDVDDTLFDNDCFEQDLKSSLLNLFGPDGVIEYWTILEEIRSSSGFADFLGAAQIFRLKRDQSPMTQELAFFFRDYPFSKNLYPGALDVLRYLKSHGDTVILSDGDAIFQPIKIDHSGIRREVDSHVLIFIHKERMLSRIESLYPADHYVMIDDKLRILSEMKTIWKDRLTSIFVRQGHYANDPALTARYPRPDMMVDRIIDLVQIR
jgi:FMN phosphatase YigB (HAD superfamily)